jgi:hypothetical protein
MARNPSFARRDPSRDAWKGRFLIAGLALFLVVDVALVAVALNSAKPSASSSAAAPVVTTSSTPRTTPTQTTTPSPTPTVASIAAVLPTRILVAQDATLAWRATTGPCPAAIASPEITTNSGKTWKSTNATPAAKVVSLQRILIEGKQVASMVGQKQSDCSPMFVRTYVAGNNYAEYPDALGGAWYINPKNRAQVHSPSGSFAAPCTNVLSIATRGQKSAAVLCDDQSIHETTDGAATWLAPTSITGAMNLAPIDGGYLVAVVGAKGCAGVQLLSIREAAASLPTPVGCFATSADPASLAGNIAVSGGAGSIWLWAGDAMTRSTNGGTTWQ